MKGWGRSRPLSCVSDYFQSNFTFRPPFHDFDIWKVYIHLFIIYLFILFIYLIFTLVLLYPAIANCTPRFWLVFHKLFGLPVKFMFMLVYFFKRMRTPSLLRMLLQPTLRQKSCSSTISIYDTARQLMRDLQPRTGFDLRISTVLHALQTRTKGTPFSNEINSIWPQNIRC